MRVFVQGLMAALLLIASIVSLGNAQFLEAAALFAGALVFGWHAGAGKSWAQWGKADSGLDFFANPAGAIADQVWGREDDATVDQPGGGEAGEPQGRERFDADAALARYMEKKAIGAVEPLVGSHDGLDAAAALPRVVFGRKAG